MRGGRGNIRRVLGGLDTARDEHHIDTCRKGEGHRLDSGAAAPEMEMGRELAAQARWQMVHDHVDVDSSGRVAESWLAN